MKISIFVFGKTDSSYINEGISDFIKRTSYFCPIEFEYFTEPKNHGKLEPTEQMLNEAELFLKKIYPDDFVVLLDEKGKTFTSAGFAKQLEQWMNSGKKRIVFIIGGAYGIHPTLKQKYASVSLSDMTFNHQLVRLVFAEQIYRAFTIIKGLPYHND
ncbi:MAG TPA: 23S rRNA (pseudouridine(1915)-N(3))-methyltransferase RlmH [Bacteroidales bacterium]|jgi:23S rRNA (pseudouridine1915-N3)-methyltransferase|nr:23S rRNA (pseudouridine(1915)-N(3))-methyltransferase RlmH [Bacteroidales bacterium]